MKLRIFKEILNFTKNSFDRPEERRRSPRYKPDPRFPLMAFLVQEYDRHQCVILDVSERGFRLSRDLGIEVMEQIEPGDQLTVEFRLMDIDFALQASVRHLTAGGVGCLILIDDYDVLYAYWQSILPVMVGRSLSECDPGTVTQGDIGFIKRLFYAQNQSSLTLWAPVAQVGQQEGNVESFEFSMDGFRVFGCIVDNLLKVQTKTMAEARPFSDLTGDHAAEEIRWFFSLMLLNVDETQHDFAPFLRSFIPL